jgi:uncharacterized damage-inducible protein DinB
VAHLGAEGGGIVTAPRRFSIEPDPTFRSREVALFVAQLEDLSRRLYADTEGLSPAELEWQPAPGTNSIGMLLAHVAYWEVYWVRAVLEARPGAIEVRDVLGIEHADVGQPMPTDGRPPTALAGRDLAYLRDLLARARAFTYTVARSVADAELDRAVGRARPDGTAVEFTPRWALYHALEHLAGHYGQINLLKHLRRERGTL